jgi:hypothetical protein
VDEGKSGTQLSGSKNEGIAEHEDRDREALRSGQMLQGSATKMGRRTHARIARQMLATNQGRGKPES